MKNMVPATIALCAAAIISVAAFAQQAPKSGMMDPAGMQKMMQDMMPASGDSASTKAFKEAHMKMMHNMHVPFSGDADRDLAQHMIPHHQGAIDMAKVQLAHGKDPEIRKMAEKMIKDAQKDISDLETWLKKKGK